MKKVLDILGIALPAFIIILGVTRIFIQKTKGVNGLTIFFAILLLLTGLIRFFFFPDGGRPHDEKSKTTPISVSRHGGAFNQSLENVLTAYYNMTDGFIDNNTEIINQSARSLKEALDSLNLAELKTVVVHVGITDTPFYYAPSGPPLREQLKVWHQIASGRGVRP